MKIVKNSITIKLTIIFLMASMVLCAIYLYFYASSMNLLKNERISAIDTVGKEYLKSLDRQITNVKRAIYNTYASQDWSMLATTKGQVEDYQVLQQVTIAKERIRAIASSSEIIEDVSVSFPKWGRTISTQGGLKEFDFNEWNNIKMPLDSVGAQIVYYEDKAYLTSKYQLPNPELFSISVRINYNKFHDLLNGTLDTVFSTFLFDVKTNQLLLKKTDGVIDEDELLTEIKAADFSNGLHPKLKIDGYDYILINNTSNYSSLRIVNAVKIDELTVPFAMQKQLVLFFMVVIPIIILLLFVYINHSFIKPINKMVQAFRPIEKGDFTVRLSIDNNGEFGILYKSFNHMVENISSLVKEVYEKELLIQRANFRQLQSQINPHFLYNSFYALSTMIKIGDEENAIAFCTYLASYYQYITRSDTDTVRIGEELMHAENYIKIMTMRNSNINVDFQKDLPQEFYGLHVPRLIIQPIIENAFEHGLKTATDAFLLKVSIAQVEEHKIFISVEDNGKCNDGDVALLNARLKEYQTIKETTALFNIHKRLRLFFGSDSGISVSKSNLGGMKVAVIICERRIPD